MPSVRDAFAEKPEKPGDWGPMSSQPGVGPMFLLSHYVETLSPERRWTGCVVRASLGAVTQQSSLCLSRCLQDTSTLYVASHLHP